MAGTSLTPKEIEAIEKYFGPLQDLSPDKFKITKKQLMAKYHPDNFEKFEDDTILEMATERFQEIETLANKVELWLDRKSNTQGIFEKINHSDAIFSFEKMKVEVLTKHSDLKYHLFGSKYRWLAFGDSYQIPDTKAKIITDESHQGKRIGYMESIRMYLTFGPEDQVEYIAIWLYSKLKGRASSIIIEGKRLDIDLVQINHAIKQRAYKGLSSPDDQQADGYLKE